MSEGYSRRELFSLFSPWRKRRSRGGSGAGAESEAGQDMVAIIQGRYCIAYSEPCTVCTDACPVPGALPWRDGVPLVNLDLCTGCGICHDVCPATPNAVLMMPRRKP